MNNNPWRVQLTEADGRTWVLPYNLPTLCAAYRLARAVAHPDDAAKPLIYTVPA